MMGDKADHAATILLVDDNQLQLETLALRLEQHVHRMGAFERAARAAIALQRTQHRSACRWFAWARGGASPARPPSPQVPSR